MNIPTNDLQDTPRGYASPPIRLRPVDRVTSRTECWRAACRSTNRGYQTISITITGKTIAFCHRKVHEGFGVRVDAWKYPA